MLAKVSDAYKTEHTRAEQQRRPLACCRFNKYSAFAYRLRILTYSDASTVSIRVIQKRITIPVAIHRPDKVPYFKGEADLVYQSGQFFLCQTLEVPEGSPVEIADFLGVDLGIVQIATNSDGEAYSGNVIENKRQKYASHRSRVKQHKTKNSRRRLKKIGNKEARFRRDVNHQISKHLVEKAERTSRGIALEDLEQFFDKTRVRHSQRAQRCSWSFFQLRSFVEYKACLAGIPVVLVDPAFTSQQCSQPDCGYIHQGNRKSQAVFCCLKCGHSKNADVNASKNIRLRAAVNLPIAASLS